VRYISAFEDDPIAVYSVIKDVPATKRVSSSSEVLSLCEVLPLIEFLSPSEVLSSDEEEINSCKRTSKLLHECDFN
jgi:hypothetical protein